MHKGFDQIVSATGRVPVTSALQLQRAGLTPLKSGHIAVDEFQNTSVKGVLALGDVCGRVELTPMAIAAGRRVADRLFGGIPDAKVDYDLVPTVVFSHPVIGTIGMTEQAARRKYSEDQLKVTLLLCPAWHHTTQCILVCIPAYLHIHSGTICVD